MSKIWPYATIRELLSLAAQQGEAKAALQSIEDAERFRFAIYNFRRQYDSDNEFSNIKITLDNNLVLLQRQDDPSITIFHQEQNYEAS